MANLTKVLRPFEGLDGCEALFREVTLSFGNTQLSVGRSATADNTGAYLRNSITIQIPFGSLDGAPLDESLVKALEDAGLQRKDVDFLVISSTGGLRHADILKRINLGKATIPQSLEFREDAKPPSLRAPRHGSTIEVMLVLTKRRKPKFARPYQIGTWLGRAKFTLLTHHPGPGFQVLPLTDEIIDRETLGKKTHWFVKILDDVELQEEGHAFGDALTIYVAQESLNSVKIHMDSADGKLIQWMLVQDAVRAILTRIHQDRRDNAPFEMPPRNSPFYDLLAMRTGEARPTDDELLDALRVFEAEPERFMADIANHNNLSDILHDALVNPD